MIANKVTTVGKVKQAGWAEVERLQKELVVINTLYKNLHQIDMLSETGNKMKEKSWMLTGKIKGMVEILNMLK